MDIELFALTSSEGLKLFATESHIDPTELPLNCVNLRELLVSRFPLASVPYQVRSTRKSQLMPVVFFGRHWSKVTEQMELSVTLEREFSDKYC